jgi:hypothetical protein
MATDFEYVDLNVRPVCPPIKGIPQDKDVCSLLEEWGIDKVSSVEAMEKWYEKAHHPQTVSIHINIPKSSEIHSQFRRLTREWIWGTEKHSNLLKIVTHPAYQQIIAMGPAVIPEILRAMTSGPGHWFWALRALTQGVDPAEGLNTMQAATDAWIKWGRENGYLDQ